jgi:hypothetical protein
MAFQEKLLTSQPPVEVGGRQYKRYYVTTETAPYPQNIEDAALRLLPELAPEPDGTPAAGFVVLHRGGDGAAYLDVFTWVWDNVLHMRGAAAAQPALGCPDNDPTHFLALENNWIGCVWELAPLAHERDAWARHMLLPSEADLAGYLKDSLPDGTTGSVG